MPEPTDLHPDDPRVLGPYRLTGRLQEHPAGVLFAAEDVAGRAAVVVVLDVGAAADAAVRDRLTAATSTLRETVSAPVFDGLREPVPWVALAADDAAAGHAIRLLDAAALANDPGTDHESTATEPIGSALPSGPDFAPHWTATGTDTSDLATGHERLAKQPRQGTSRGVLAAAFTVFGLAVIGLVVAIAMLLGRLADGAEDRASSEPPAETDASLAPDEFDPPDDSAAPDWWPEFDEYDGPDGPPGPVAGPTYGEEEPVREQSHPLTFDLPQTYGCLGDGGEDLPAGSVLCIDESQAFEAEGTPPGGRIRVDPCDSPCAADTWEETRIEQAGSELPWEPVDDATLYMERPGTSDDGEDTVLVAMSRVIEAPDTDSDLVLFVSLTGRGDDLPTFQKIVNELYERTEAP